jgi:hypothetical protein
MTFASEVLIRLLVSTNTAVLIIVPVPVFGFKSSPRGLEFSTPAFYDPKENNSSFLVT